MREAAAGFCRRRWEATGRVHRDHRGRGSGRRPGWQARRHLLGGHRTKPDPTLILSLNIVGTLCALGLVTWIYGPPRLRALAREDALRLLVLPHTLRFVGLSFLVDGVVSPALPSEFSTPAAWGDFTAAVLALLVVASLTLRWSFTVPLVWIFSLWGTIDLLYANVNAIRLDIDPGEFGAAYYIPTVWVPLLLVSHGLVFWLLLGSRQTAQTVDGL
jgi:hypothetical protein